MKRRTLLVPRLRLPLLFCTLSVVGCESVDPNDDESEPVEHCTALGAPVVTEFYEQASDEKDLVVYSFHVDDLELALEIYGEGDFPPLEPGSTFLGLEGESNYQTCTRCLLLTDQDGKTYFVDDGILELETFEVGATKGTISDMHFVEVTIDADTSLSTPVEDGACFTLDAMAFDTSVPPEGWACSAEQYSDAQCHCGCGLVDPWCADATAASCEVDTCPEGELPGEDDNSACVDAD